MIRHGWLACSHIGLAKRNSGLLLAPEADFAPDWVPAAAFILGGLILMLLLVMLFARQQAKRMIVLPLEDLTKAFARIGQLDFQSEPPTSSEIEEVRQLSFAYEAMHDMLQKNQLQIAMQKQVLHDKIEALQTAEKTIKESEAYNKVLFSDSAIALVVLDPQAAYSLIAIRRRSLFMAYPIRHHSSAWPCRTVAHQPV